MPTLQHERLIQHRNVVHGCATMCRPPLHHDGRMHVSCHNKESIGPQAKHFLREHHIIKICDATNSVNVAFVDPCIKLY